MDPFATITFDGMKVENAVGVFQAREERRDNARASSLISCDFNRNILVLAALYVRVRIMFINSRVSSLELC